MQNCKTIIHTAKNELQIFFQYQKGMPTELFLAMKAFTYVNAKAIKNSEIVHCVSS